ncbi:MAG: hypothetical protein LRY55_01990 [Leadbetterella sp.]|nr:hypothetical protein [Leadbetterella sp.]
MVWLSGPSKVVFKVEPDSSLRFNPDYPPFRNGILTIHAKGVAHKITLTENTESEYEGLPKSLIGSSVTASLESPYWKLKSGSITVGKTTSVELVPNGSLGLLYGNIVDQYGSPVRDAFIQVGSDTVLYSDQQGLFRAELSYALQKESQHLTVSKSGYTPLQLNHRPGQNLVVRMMRIPQGNRAAAERGKGNLLANMLLKQE